MVNIGILDDYDEEPLPANHSLRTEANVICTPHIGYVTEPTYEVFHRTMVDVIRAYLAGEPVPELV